MPMDRVAQSGWMDGPGSNPGGDEIFLPSRPALGPTQPPVQWVPGLSPGVKCGREMLLTTHPLLVPRSWKISAIPLPTFHPLGHTGPVTGTVYTFCYCVMPCTPYSLSPHIHTTFISDFLFFLLNW